MLSIDPVLDLLGRAVDLSALRQSVHAANIANANTEGYARIEVVVDRAVDNAEGDAVGEPRLVRAPGETVRLDEEMAAMAENAVRYQTLLDAFASTMSMLRSAARDGRE